MPENSIQIFGWLFRINPVAFKIPGLGITVYWYGIIITVGMLLAIVYAMVNAKRFKIKTDPMIDVILITTIGGIIGARLYFILFNLDSIKKPIDIIATWQGGIAIYGAIIFGFLTALLMCKWKKIRAFAFFDLASLSMLIGQAIGRWGNFVNQEAYGSKTTLPWAMQGDKINREMEAMGETLYHGQGVHPTFLYESLWNIIGFIILHFVSKKWRKFNGQIFFMYIGWYGLGRMFIEGLRTDSLMLGPFRVSQLVAAISVVLSVVLLAYFFKNPSKRLAIETGSEDDLLQEETEGLQPDMAESLEQEQQETEIMQEQPEQELEQQPEQQPEQEAEQQPEQEIEKQSEQQEFEQEQQPEPEPEQQPEQEQENDKEGNANGKDN